MILNIILHELLRTRKQFLFHTLYDMLDIILHIRTFADIKAHLNSYFFFNNITMNKHHVDSLS